VSRIRLTLRGSLVEVFRLDRIIPPVHLFALVSSEFHGRHRVDPCSFEIGYGIAFLYTGTLAECLGVALCVCGEPRLDISPPKA
jgi:hypothetical protein